MLQSSGQQRTVVHAQRQAQPALPTARGQPRAAPHLVHWLGTGIARTDRGCAPQPHEVDREGERMAWLHLPARAYAEGGAAQTAGRATPCWPASMCSMSLYYDCLFRTCACSKFYMMYCVACSGHLPEAFYLFVMRACLLPYFQAKLPKGSKRALLPRGRQLSHGTAAHILSSKGRTAR